MLTWRFQQLVHIQEQESIGHVVKLFWPYLLTQIPPNKITVHDIDKCGAKIYQCKYGTPDAVKTAIYNQR